GVVGGAADVVTIAAVSASRHVDGRFEPNRGSRTRAEQIRPADGDYELVFGLRQAFGAHRGFREDRLLVAPRLRGKLLRRRLDLGRNRRDAQTRIPGA